MTAFSDKIVRPVVTLAEAMTRFAKGDYSQRVSYARCDPIGDLCRTFNSMADSIAKQQARMENEIRLRTDKANAAGQP